MPKKITITSGIALILLTVLITVVIKLSEKPKSGFPEPPEKVSVLFSEENIIKIMPYEEFLLGCVRGLLPFGIPPSSEAVKAIAAAEHTRALYTLEHKTPAESYSADFVVSEDFPYTEKSEDKEDISKYYELEALPLILYNGELINSPMCRISTGVTDAALPFSPSLPLLCDVGINGYDSTSVFTYENIRRSLGAKVISPNFAEWFHNPVYADSGTLIYIGFSDERITGSALRKALGLRSTAITVECEGDYFRFTCKGLGENRGMSAAAAIFLADNGKTAEEILATFYPDCELINRA